MRQETADVRKIKTRSFGKLIWNYKKNLVYT